MLPECCLNDFLDLTDLGDHLHPYLQMVLEFEMRDYNILPLGHQSKVGPGQGVFYDFHDVNFAALSTRGGLEVVRVKQDWNLQIIPLPSENLRQQLFPPPTENCSFTYQPFNPWHIIYKASHQKKLEVLQLVPMEQLCGDPAPFSCHLISSSQPSLSWPCSWAQHEQ